MLYVHPWCPILKSPKYLTPSMSVLACQSQEKAMQKSRPGHHELLFYHSDWMVHKCIYDMIPLVPKMVKCMYNKLKV